MERMTVNWSAILARLRDFFAKADAGKSGLDGAKGAAILGRGVGLGVERFLMGHPAGEENVDDRLGHGLV